MNAVTGLHAAMLNGEALILHFQSSTDSAPKPITLHSECGVLEGFRELRVSMARRT